MAELSEEEKEVVELYRSLRASGADRQSAWEAVRKKVQADTGYTGKRVWRPVDEEMEAEIYAALDEGRSIQDIWKTYNVRPSDVARLAEKYQREIKRKTEEEFDLVKEYKKALVEAQRFKLMKSLIGDEAVPGPGTKGQAGGFDPSMAFMLLMTQNMRQPESKQLDPIQLMTAMATIQEKMRGKEMSMQDMIALISSIFDLKDRAAPPPQQVSIPVRPQEKTLKDLIAEKIGDVVEKSVIDTTVARVEDLIKRPEAMKQPTWSEQLKEALSALDQSGVGDAIKNELIPTISQYVQSRVAQQQQGYTPRTPPPPDPSVTPPQSPPVQAQGTVDWTEGGGEGGGGAGAGAGADEAQNAG